MKKTLSMSTIVFILGIVVSVFPLSSPRLVSPLSNTFDALDSALPKLERNPNSYFLHKKTTFIPQAIAAEDVEKASAYVVTDFDSGNVISEKNMSTPVPMASLTKIMTAIVALDLASPQETFTIRPNVKRIEPTIMGLRPGEVLSLDELLHGLLLYSANDSAEAIKDGIDEMYRGDIFIRSMNAKAEFIGLKHTHFTNPQGFDNPEHLSSAEDLAILSHYALSHYPLISEIVQKDEVILPESSTHHEFKLYNWNGLLGVYPNVSGIKIGNTDAAGKTTVVLSEREGKKILVTLLGAPGILERDEWAAELLDSGFQTLADLPPVHITEEQLREKYSTWIY